MSARRFPPPWSVEEQDACFVVRDRVGQPLAYVYFENELGDERGGVNAADRLCIHSRDADLCGYIRNVSRRAYRTANRNTSRLR
jgi:hypothetical protein